MKTLLYIALSLVFVSCSKLSKKPPEDMSGDYYGKFERDGQSSNISLTFTENTFEGESELAKFPAICKGEYDVSNQTISFNDECIWTADFDWSLILKGNWDCSFKNNELQMTNDLGDRYILTKEN